MKVRIFEKLDYVSNFVSYSLLYLFISTLVFSILRSWVGITPIFGQIVGFVLTGGIFYFIYSRFKNEFIKIRFSFFISTLVLFLYSFYQIYHPLYNGAISTGGGDAGVHIDIAHSFNTDETVVYEGMVSYYGMFNFFKNFISISSFHSVLITYYLSLFVYMGFIIYTIWLNLVSLRNSLENYWANFIAILTIVTVGFLVLEFHILPLSMYMYGDGFYPHHYVMIPLTLGVLCYSYFKERIWQVLSLLIMVGCMRYTYILNGMDLALVTAIILLLERNNFEGAKLKVLSSLISFVLIIFSIIGYSKMYPLIDHPGGLRRFPEFSPLVYMTFSSWLLLFYSFKFEEGKKLKRLAILIFSWGAVVSTISILVVLSGIKRDYYFYKYFFVPSMFYSVFSSIYIGSKALEALNYIFRMIKNNSFHRKAFIFQGTTVVIAVLAAVGFFYYANSFKFIGEVYFKSRDKKIHHIGYNYDKNLANFILNKLRENGKKLGTFYTSSWAEFRFTNAALNAKYRASSAWHEGLYADEKGYCNFWRLPERDGGRGPTKNGVQEIYKKYEENIICEKYSPNYLKYYNPPVRLDICYQCL